LRRNPEQPFFLVASFDNPHNICEYARHQNPPYASFEEPALEDCPGLPANFAVNPYDADALAFERRQNHRLYPTVTFTPDDWRRYRNAYYRLIEAVDKEIGKILDEVDKRACGRIPWLSLPATTETDAAHTNGTRKPPCMKRW
jgi:arylsulfatase A-like enzyme